MEYDHLISLRLPAYMREALDWIAAELEISRSELIRDLVDDFLMGEPEGRRKAATVSPVV